MENQNNQPNLIAEQPVVVVKKSPGEMIKLGLAQISAKFSAPFAKKQTAPINIIAEKGTVAGSIDANQDGKKFILFGATFIGVVILIIIAAVIISRMRGNGVSQTPSNSPTPAAVVFTPSPNKYAADPDIVKLQNDIQSFDEELRQIDVEESNLKPRPYLWNINFQ